MRSPNRAPGGAVGDGRGNPPGAVPGVSAQHVWVPTRVEATWGAIAGIGVACLGTPLGLLAAACTPRLATGFYYAADGRTLFPSEAVEGDRAAIGGDAVMLAVLAGAGVMVGLLALLARRRAPLGVVVGVLVGGLVGGEVAMAVAHLVVHGDQTAHVVAVVRRTGGIFQARPYIRGRVDFVALPAAALLVFLLGNVRYLLSDSRRARAQPLSAAPEPVAAARLRHR